MKNNKYKNDIYEKINNIFSPSLIISLLVTFFFIVITLTYNENISNSSCSGFECLGNGLGVVIMIIINVGLILLTWLVYVINLTRKLSKKKSKYSWMPITIFIFIIILARLAFYIPNLVKNGVNLITDYTIIESYDKVSDIPVLDGYLQLDKDIQSKDVFQNIDNYVGKKVLVVGEGQHLNASNKNNFSYLKGEIARFGIYNNDKTIRFDFSFVDKNSEFKEDNYPFFTKKGSNNDYYAFVYGTISSKTIFKHGSTNINEINIKPDKIYYSTNWDTIYLKEESIVYSQCAKSGNICTEDEIKNGQVVNVPVNDKEKLDFYVIQDDGQFLTLLGYNALSSDKYLSENDTLELMKINKENKNVNDDLTNYHMYNYWGPYTLQKKLNELTSNWTNIKSISNYSYIPSNENIYKGFTINNGRSNIVSASGNSVIIPGETVARLLSKKDLDNDFKKLDFLAKPCLRSHGIREGAYCQFWLIDDSSNYDVTTISSSYKNNTFSSNLIRENIHATNYIVPVIVLEKEQLNNY